MTDSPTPLERQQLDLADPSAHTFWHWVRFELVADVADAHGADTIADIGAGSGMLGDRLAETHRHLTYRFDELSPALDAALAERYGDASRLGHDERLQKNVTAAMLDVIEHIDDDVATLAAWRARMESGVRLVVTVPAGPWAFSKFDQDLGHFRRYSKRQLRSSLISAGFEVEHCAYLFPELLPIVVKRRLRPSTNTVDMPYMSPWKNRVGFAVSSTTAKLRRIWPLGTSVVAVATAS